MKTRMILTFGLSAFVLGGTTVGCTMNSNSGGGIASASNRDAPAAARAAKANAAKAGRALGADDAVAAIGYAEGAVALAPRTAAYRSLLAQSYLRAGRFASAGQAYRDVLALTPTDGKAALNLALAQVAGGDWHSARSTLQTYAAIIPARDLGLAVALAGDPASGVTILTQAARTPGADAKVRQNLALALALAGQWQSARVVASADMSPADVDARMEEWAAFAQPKAASDQVAALLGVRPAADGGQPVAFALNAPVDPVRVADAAPAPAMVPAVAPDPVARPATLTAFKVAFAAPREVVQPLPTVILPSAVPAKLSLAAWTPRAVGTGDWYVQIGAFSNAGVARDAWGRATRRFASLSGRTPTGATVASRAGSLYRLSVGGFARGDADALCRRYRATGGVCFVRRHAGDQTAQWLHKPLQVAAR